MEDLKEGARDWDALFQTFLKEKRYLKNVTPRTLQGYETAWKAFQRYGKTDLSAQGVKNFVIEMAQSGMKPGAANSFARSINSFLTWLFESEYIEAHLKIPIQSAEKRVLHTYTSEEVKKILSFKPRYFGEKRLMTMLYLMTDTGIRVDEARSLKRLDVDFDSLLITVLGKGRKERKIPISLEARKVLYKWLKEHNHKIVFCTYDGDKVIYNNVRRDFLKILKKVGIEQSEGCFHAFRRFFAKSYNRNGGNLFYLQKMLGHASLEMTRRYTDVDEETLSTHHLQFSPLKSLKEKEW